jgi:ATP-dependent helicase HrpB
LNRLPIYEIESELAAALSRERRLLISAPTGSGKSTQVPQMLLGHGLLGAGQVVVLQPRRLAARLLAARVASERHSALGDEVGYQIRFESVTSEQTRIRFVTEGVLLRQMTQDPGIEGVTALIFDEFHERHLYGDITLAQALDLQEKHRPDLKILVMSATLDLESLQDYLRPCRVLESKGRAFPVDVEYATMPGYMDKRPVWQQAADAFGDYIQSGGHGDVLIFMPGGFEISQTIDALRQSPDSHGFVLLPLHGELPPREQDAAVARYDKRKVVVATNVAETSLTIDGIRCVIDSGLARIPRFDPYRGINTLLVEKISRASADQRAGRAGRTAPGLCQRLWSREEHAHRPARELPEVNRLDLAEVVLTLKAAGVEDLRKFRWLEPPTNAALSGAEELLEDLGALEKNPGAPQTLSRITPLGRGMLAFPLHPRYGRMLLAAREHDCVYEACLIAALTQGRELLMRNVDAETAEARRAVAGSGNLSDFQALIQLWQHAAAKEFRPETCRHLGLHPAAARQVSPLLDQFLNIARRQGLDVSRRDPPESALRKCILLGFSDRVGRRLDANGPRCELVHGRRGILARESVLQDSALLVASEIREVEGKDKNLNTVLSLATAIEESWLEGFFPHDIKTSERAFYDTTARRVFAEEQLCFRGLTIGARRMEPPADTAARLLADEVLAGRLVLAHWDESVDQWILRLNLLGQWCPELELPPIAEAEKRYLVEQVCFGSLGYKDLKDKPVMPVVKSWLSAAQQEMVEKHAPERLRLANGRTPRVIYDGSNPPRVALRIQELYGVTSTPRIAMNRVPVVVEILAPSRRPVQITQDLERFWREHYPRIKQELQRKYPRHEWK